MDALRLLDRAREAGLAIATAGDKLIVRGPRQAEPVVRLLAANKGQILAALADPRTGKVGIGKRCPIGTRCTIKTPRPGLRGVRCYSGGTDRMAHACPSGNALGARDQSVACPLCTCRTAIVSTSIHSIT